MISNGASLTGFEHAQAARIYCDLHQHKPEAADMLLKRYVVNAGFVPEDAVLDISIEEQPVTPDLDDLWVVIGFQYSMVGGVPSKYTTFSILALRGQTPDDKPPRLVELESDVEREFEGHALTNALQLQMLRDELRRTSTRVFSLRDGRGQSLLALSVRDGVCRHVVGPFNRPPTPTELLALEPLLATRQIKLEYMPSTAY